MIELEHTREQAEEHMRGLREGNLRGGTDAWVRDFAKLHDTLAAVERERDEAKERCEELRWAHDKWRDAARNLKDEACLAGNWERAAGIRDTIALAAEKPKRCRIVVQEPSSGWPAKWLIFVGDREHAYGFSKEGESQARRDAAAVAKGRGLELCDD